MPDVYHVGILPFCGVGLDLFDEFALVLFGGLFLGLGEGHKLGFLGTGHSEVSEINGVVEAALEREHNGQ